MPVRTGAGFRLRFFGNERGQRGKAPWATGEVPIKEVLQLLKREKYPMVADIEYDDGAADPGNEAKKCFAYCRSAVTASAPNLF